MFSSTRVLLTSRTAAKRLCAAYSTTLQMPSSVASVRVANADGQHLAHDAALDESGKSVWKLCS
jgi:hypothetical protein